MKNILVVLLFLLSQVSLSQGIKVIDIKETVSGSDAFHAPIDNNGHPCGLIKVQSVLPDLCFSGDVVGEVASENNEYKVYLAKGSKRLVIKRPQVMPIVIHFPDYGIDEIASKATYTIKLKEASLNPIKNLLVIDIKPRTAKVYIDDVLIDNENGDGAYRLLIPKGDHTCKIEAKGYRTNASVIKIGKGTQTINVELESLLADIEINSKTSGAHIIVDGEEIGIGSWKGKLPAGTYKVDIQLEGYVPHSQSLKLDEKDNQILNIPPLKRAKGSLAVITNINDIEVYLDGNRVNNPKHISEIQSGNHVLSVKAPFGYKEVKKTIMISSGDNNSLKIEMEPIDDLYAKAFAGDTDAQVEICQRKMNSSKYQDRDTIERNYWYDRIYENLDNLNKSSLEKVWGYYGPSQRQIEGIYEYFDNDHIKSIKFLHRAIKLGYMEYGLLAHHYFELGKYEDAILYWTKDINYPEYDFYFSDELTEACFKLNDINKGIAIINGAIEKDWDDAAKSVAYEGIGNIYSKIHNNPQAVQYYKKSLQLWLKLKSMNYDWVDDNINRMKDKIRQSDH